MPIQPWDRPRVASASIARVSEAPRDVDLLFKRHLPDEGMSFGVCSSPETLAFPLSCETLVYASNK